MIYLHAPDSAYGYYRAVAPIRHCSPILTEEGITLVGSETTNIDVVKKFNVFMFHGIVPPNVLSWMMQLKGKVKLVWMVDDNWLEMDSWNPNQLDISSRAVHDATLDLVDEIVATTKPLAKIYKTQLIAPNLIDMVLYPEPNLKKGKKCLWQGGSSHAGDLELLSGLSCDVVFFGDLPASVMGFERVKGRYYGTFKPLKHNMGYVPGTLYSRWLPTMRGIDADIGLCPVTDTPFNRCKSNLKQLEYSAMGMPVIASDIGIYDIVDSYDGYLVQDGWMDAISKCNSDMGMNGYYKIKHLHSWQSSAISKWLNVFRSLDV